MEWPQITILILYFLHLCIAFSKHGEPKDSNYNAGVAMFDVGAYIAILYFGGFFN